MTKAEVHHPRSGFDSLRLHKVCVKPRERVPIPRPLNAGQGSPMIPMDWRGRRFLHALQTWGRQQNTAVHDSAEIMDEIDDGFGNVWVLCKPDCRLEVVRPGKVQCDCHYEDDEDA